MAEWLKAQLIIGYLGNNVWGPPETGKNFKCAICILFLFYTSHTSFTIDLDSCQFF